MNLRNRFTFDSIRRSILCFSVLTWRLFIFLNIKNPLSLIKRHKLFSNGNQLQPNNNLVTHKLLHTFTTKCSYIDPVEVDIPVCPCSGRDESVSKFTGWRQRGGGWCPTMQFLQNWRSIHVLIYKWKEVSSIFWLKYSDLTYVRARLGQVQCWCTNPHTHRKVRNDLQQGSSCHFECWFGGEGDVHILDPS